MMAKLPQGFDAPTALPQTPDEAERWQKTNRSWWENHPMRYDWQDKIPAEEFSREFYDTIDQRFFSLARQYMPWSKIPFDPLIDFETLARQDVLEIGVGNGSHAGLLARHARSFTGIDLTDYAVRSTSSRLAVFGLPGTVRRMDAEKLEFDDQQFDFIWTWGVIHHSANTPKILREMARVLRPGGQAVTMVYNRSLWHYYFMEGVLGALRSGRVFKRGFLHESIQLRTDGGLARYYRPNEWRALTQEYFNVESILVYGNKAEALPLPAGRMKSLLLHHLPNSLTRLLTNSLRQGSFLVSRLRKR